VFQRRREVAENEFVLNLTVYRTSRCLRLAPATATDQGDADCYGAPEPLESPVPPLTVP
jgi:hypothetical protein